MSGGDSVAQSWPLPDATWRQRCRRSLLAWFRRNARDLPWRRTRDPYAIWVSEIMLQQTQVATVVNYFSRFMQAFPTVGDLAAADEQQVLRLWEGLGYYRRARQLHRAAQIVVAEQAGKIPRDIERLRGLPGIGRYTAGAIASIAWDAREPILEANTIRLLSRLLAYRGDPRSSAGQELLWRFTGSLLPRREAGMFNQALMELGSEICTPRSPRCDECPLRTLCPTREMGLQDSIPSAAKRPRYEDIVEAAVVVFRGEQVLLRRCGPDERWAGLWDFPRFPLANDAGDGAGLDQVIAASVAALTGIRIRPRHLLATIKHGVTRFRITLHCHAADYLSGEIHQGNGAELRWVAPHQLPEYPLSSTGRRISDRLVND